MNYEFFSLTMILRGSIRDEFYLRTRAEFLIEAIATEENA